MSQQRYATVLLFGAPGVGKGTQGKILGTIPGLRHLSSGEIFRALDPESNLGKEVQEHVSRGELVPDDLTIRIWKRWLDRDIAEGRFHPDDEILVLDGIPRNVEQCKILDESLDVRRVVYLACSNAEPLVQRIKHRAVVEGRADDADEEIIRRRFKVYRDESAPILHYYPAEMTSAIDPLGLPAEVLQRILQCLIPVLREFLKA